MVCPNLEVVTQPLMIFGEVVDDDYFLPGVTIPPFVGVLNESLGVLSPGHS